MMRYLTLFLIFLNFCCCQGQSQKLPLTANSIEVKTVTFYAPDSVQITADTYFLKDVPPTILLCHQAGYSRGEYVNTAKKLNDLGFSCMAIDQRSGKEVNGIINQTARDANNKMRNVGYAGAKQDIEAAIDYLYSLNGEQPILLVGSSYSASLALWIAAESDKVKAVAAFSPGEYLTGMSLNDTIKRVKIPLFITSSKREIKPVEQLVNKIKPKYITFYKPSKKGIHGSRALWESTIGNEGYWNAFRAFILTQK